MDMINVYACMYVKLYLTAIVDFHKGRHICQTWAMDVIIVNNGYMIIVIVTMLVINVNYGYD
jgi:hypothetical protein